MHLTDYPHPVPLAQYDMAIQKMVEKLVRQDGVISIYQIGNVSNPGISDIDFLVVFENGTRCNLNPVTDLSKTERYLFSHSLYGISKSHFADAQRYSLFDNYNLLRGEELSVEQDNYSGKEIDILKTQIALEYMIKMFINSTVEKTYGIARVRGLLVLAKALSYDLEFLQVTSGKLFDLIQTVILWRDKWFENQPDGATVREWFNQFHKELTAFLGTTLKKNSFFMPAWTNMSIAQNMSLTPSETVGYTHKGITLPAILGDLGRKYFNIQHRFNSFKFHIPITTSGIPDGLLRRFSHIKDIKAENALNLPHFMVPTSALHISLKIAA